MKDASTKLIDAIKSGKVFLLGEEANKVENLKGEWVKRKPDARKVYKVVGYCRINRAYQLDDYEDISRCIYVKKGTVLYTGFTY